MDRIYAEDTRHSRPLLQLHGIDTPVYSLHEHNETSRIESILQLLLTGACVAVISDAGTPLISDPGYRLVRACLHAQLRVSPIPGASALTTALSVAGLPTDRFLFVGFAPARSVARRHWLGELVGTPCTLILYESTHRIVATLTDVIAEFGGDRQVTLCRELTKQYETIMHANVADVLDCLLQDTDQQRGEFVLLIAGAPDRQPEQINLLELDQLLCTLLKHMPVAAAAKCAAELRGVPRNWPISKH